MMSFWHKSLPTKPAVSAGTACLTVVVCLCLVPSRAVGQARDDVLSQREVDALRDSAFVPSDRITTFERFLDERKKRIDELLSKRKGHTDYGSEMHDALEQFGAIVDELNDNLDEYSHHHRDVRKVLPKLIESTERWTTALNAPGDNEAYSVVRKIAVDNLKDTRELAQALQTDLDAYFKAHPEAEKEEKKRTSDPHAVRNGEGPG